MEYTEYVPTKLDAVVYLRGLSKSVSESVSQSKPKLCRQSDAFVTDGINATCDWVKLVVASPSFSSSSSLQFLIEIFTSFQCPGG